MNMVDVKIKQLHVDAVIPTYAHEGDAGADLYSIERVILNPNETKIIKTGLSVELPKGYEWQIRPRSGMSVKTQLMVSNSPGTVDERYRGEVGVIMFNPTPKTIKIDKGTRIAQAVLKEVPRANFVIVGELSTTERGEGGFGSTGEKEVVSKSNSSNALPGFKELQELKTASPESQKEIDEIKDIVAEPQEIVEATETIPETKADTDLTVETESIVEVSKTEEKKVHNIVNVYNDEGSNVGSIEADTSEVTDVEEIEDAVVKVHGLVEVRTNRFLELISKDHEIEELFNRAKLKGFNLHQYVQGIAQEQIDSDKCPDVEALNDDFKTTLLSYSTDVSETVVSPKIVEESTDDNPTEEIVREEFIEKDKTDISSSVSEEEYTKYSPMFDQAVESFCKNEDNKAMFELACESTSVEDIKLKLILKIVENQLSGIKTIVVNELKTILEKVLK